MAAFTAGSNPNTTPIIVENAIARITAGILIAIGTFDIFPITSANAIPVIVPMMPPRLVSTAASVKNCASIQFFLAPIAFFKPISLVRSVTDTSMIFITPIPPTNNEILAIHINCLFVVALTC